MKSYNDVDLAGRGPKLHSQKIHPCRLPQKSKSSLCDDACAIKNKSHLWAKTRRPRTQYGIQLDVFFTPKKTKTTRDVEGTVFDSLILAQCCVNQCETHIQFLPTNFLISLQISGQHAPFFWGWHPPPQWVRRSPKCWWPMVALEGSFPRLGKRNWCIHGCLKMKIRVFPKKGYPKMDGL